jgi:hypothetical protein
MSESSSDQRNQGSGGQRRSGGSRRRRNNGGRNRDNRGNQNRNNRDRRGGQQGRRGGGGGDSRGGSRSGPRRQTKPAPLTWWQKLLKAIGLYDPDKAPKRTSPSRVPAAPAGTGKKTDTRSGRKPKTGTRTARSEPKPVETNRLYIGNLSYDATESDLEDLFKGAGSVGSIEIVYNRNTHRSKGYGFIEMGSIDEAKRAVEILHDQSFMDRQMIVSGAKSKGPADSEDSEYLDDSEGEAAPTRPAPEETVAETSYPLTAEEDDDAADSVKPSDGSEEAA